MFGFNSIEIHLPHFKVRIVHALVCALVWLNPITHRCCIVRQLCDTHLLQLLFYPDVVSDLRHLTSKCFSSAVPDFAIFSGVFG